MTVTPSFTGSFRAISNGSRIFQYLAMITGTLSILCSGMHYGWPSPSLPQLQDPASDIEVTNSDGSWIAVMPLLGSIVGSFVSGVILNRIGRKRVILAVSFPFFFSWLMVAFGRSATALIIARWVAGFADGLACCAVPMYLGEISEPSIRGLLGSSVSVTWIVGVLLINLIGSYLSITITALICSVIPVISFATFMWLPESPYYLIIKQDFKRAQESLRIFRGSENVDEELERLKYAVAEDAAVTGNALDLFRIKSNRKALVVMLGLRGAQQLSGSIAVMFYAQIIFEETGSEFSASTASIILFSVQVVVCMLSSIFVDKTGRRPLLIVSIIGSGICLLTEGVYFYFHKATDIDVTHLAAIPVVALIAFIIVFSIGMQTIPVLVLSELFAPSVKPYALSFADLYFCSIATLVSKYFQIVKDDFGIHVPFFTFAGACVLGLVFIIFWVPETKGKTLEEIQDNFKGKPKLRLQLEGIDNLAVVESDFKTTTKL